MFFSWEYTVYPFLFQAQTHHSRNGSLLTSTLSFILSVAHLIRLLDWIDVESTVIRIQELPGTM